MSHREKTNEDHAANPGYAAFQIARALAACEQHEDAATRERARAKVGKWTCVLEGMLSGQLTVGARQPMADLPVWATPEVVTGGFATGRLLAGGEFQSHEIALAGRIGAAPTGDNRQMLNAWFLTDTGLAELAERLRSVLYDIQVPEEAALLVVAWLAGNDKADEARELLDALSPQFTRLRFYPAPAERPVLHGARIFLERVGTVIERLRCIHPHPRISAQREAVQVWAPLYQQMIELFIETVGGDVPTIQPDVEGRWTSPETRRFNVVGGWPCRFYAADWRVPERRSFPSSRRERHIHSAADLGMARIALPASLASCGNAATVRIRSRGVMWE
jgi:hypothetical protein